MSELTGLTVCEMFKRIAEAPGQTGSARSVEWFGWLILVEGALILLWPDFVAAVLDFADLDRQGSKFFRLCGLLVAGLGSLYVISGRLNSTGFVFASMLDRPLVPPIMLGLWYFEVLPPLLALAFSVQDGAGFVWTWLRWRAENH